MTVQKLRRSDLWNLETYAGERPAFRARVIEHKKPRRVALHPNATLSFEDTMTIRYQVQEMLRVERIFEPAEIEAELDAYNPLIPDGANWKGTFMIEFPDVDERREALASMPGVEHTVWVQVGDRPKLYAIANEDMERSTDDKTAAVHFLRFELDPASAQAAKAGDAIRMGIDHDRLRAEVTLADASRRSLVADLT
jgi:hypothetical protein